MIASRSTGLFSVVVFFAILLLIFSTSPAPAVAPTSAEGKPASYADYVPKPRLPKLDNFRVSFRPAAHKPQEQENSSSGNSKWYSHWKWLSPFSSSITLDENRSVLPAIRERRPVYTYYDSTTKKDKELKEADRQLLRAWRRAWFAQGFRPVVLGPSEAMNNPLYQTFQQRGLAESGLGEELMKWMAWGNMGTGILADWRCFPMAHYDDPLLLALRRGTIPTHITHLQNLGSALFSGEHIAVNQIVKNVFQHAAEKKVDTIFNLVSDDLFKEEKSSSIAFYDIPTLKSKYGAVAEKLENSPAEGQRALVELINSHLQITFQNTFSAGIAVLKPYPEDTTALVSPSLRLASLLAECYPTPVAKSCPPNNSRCTPCSTARPMKIAQPNGYTNESSVFTIGNLPHPYTLISLRKHSDNVTVSYIRRETERDSWLIEATKPTLGTERDGASRTVPFKEAVAGDFGMPRTIWFTVENLPAKPVAESLPSELIDDLEWRFGFLIPRKTQAEAENKDKAEGADQEKLQKEYDLIEKARKVINSKEKKDTSIREVAEAWNLADTEVWRFVRAYGARAVVERKKWEEEEKGFSGS